MPFLFYFWPKKNICHHTKMCDEIFNGAHAIKLYILILIKHHTLNGCTKMAIVHKIIHQEQKQIDEKVK